MRKICAGIAAACLLAGAASATTITMEEAFDAYVDTSSTIEGGFDLSGYHDQGLALVSANLEFLFEDDADDPFSSSSYLSSYTYAWRGKRSYSCGFFSTCSDSFDVYTRTSTRSYYEETETTAVSVGDRTENTGSSYERRDTSSSFQWDNAAVWDGNNKIRDYATNYYTYTYRYSGPGDLAFSLTDDEIAAANSQRSIDFMITAANGDFQFQSAILSAEFVVATPTPAAGGMLVAAVAGLAYWRRLRKPRALRPTSLTPRAS